MTVSQILYKNGSWEIPELNIKNSQPSNSLLITFINRIEYENDSKQPLQKLMDQFPGVASVSLSTSGNITNDSQVLDSAVSNFIQFDQATVNAVQYSIKDFESESQIGKTIFEQLYSDELKHIILFSVGNEYNTSEIIEGINQLIPKNITISGGIAGDGPHFEKTIVGLNNTINDHSVVAIGLYGDKLHIETNSNGGWKAFGPKRIVTKSKRNKLFEIDHQPAVQLYKKYLGEEYSKDLPESALLFPLEVQRQNSDFSLVRTILSLDNQEQSMTFAGDIPEGSTIRLMRTNNAEIILASGHTLDEISDTTPQLAMLVSCIGRRLILGARTEEEIEEIRYQLPKECAIFGFYSYGEISMNQLQHCEVYNQTMTITTISEKV